MGGTIAVDGASMGGLLACEAVRAPPPLVSAAPLEEELAAGAVLEPQCAGLLVLLAHPSGGES